MSTKRRPQLTPEEIAATRDEVTAPATEIMGHLYQSLLKTPEFTLRDGRTCKVDKYYAPELNDEGELKCTSMWTSMTAPGLNSQWAIPAGASLSSQRTLRRNRARPQPLSVICDTQPWVCRTSI